MGDADASSETTGRPLALCLAGPTGIGKTALALALAERLPLEVISVDSAQVYRHMDIGTAKPGPAERAQVPHHLIDIREPWERYSAGEFRRDALRLIGEIRGRGRWPLLAGGTLLYFRALQRGLAPLPPADAALRRRLDAEAAARGWPALHARLREVDPAAAARIEPADRQRIQRALEVFELTGEPISRLQARHPEPPPVEFLSFALLPADRAALYARIERRFAAMLAAGLADELRALHAMPELDGSAPALRALGYRQLWDWADGRCTLAEATARAVTATRRYAKRQLSWLRSEPGFRALPAGDVAGNAALIAAAAGA
ncbi:MAG: tRNA (adenosine(37)-N6)-dimethylallyltransferase MiaA [Gammaproteobacteria bacterium]|nr:MAG: tRNA (adenosine(37)-N6)-dimethylallyltransferase MiaA [Gammaproteobacteria bacterium]